MQSKRKLINFCTLVMGTLTIVSTVLYATGRLDIILTDPLFYPLSLATAGFVGIAAWRIACTNSIEQEEALQKINENVKQLSKERTLVFDPRGRESLLAYTMTLQEHLTKALKRMKEVIDGNYSIHAINLELQTAEELLQDPLKWLPKDPRTVLEGKVADLAADKQALADSNKRLEDEAKLLKTELSETTDLLNQVTNLDTPVAVQQEQNLQTIRSLEQKLQEVTKLLTKSESERRSYFTELQQKRNALEALRKREGLENQDTTPPLPPEPSATEPPVEPGGPFQSTLGAVKMDHFDIPVGLPTINDDWMTYECKDADMRKAMRLNGLVVRDNHTMLRHREGYIVPKPIDFCTAINHKNKITATKYPNVTTKYLRKELIDPYKAMEWYSKFLADPNQLDTKDIRTKYFRCMLVSMGLPCRMNGDSPNGILQVLRKGYVDFSKLARVTLPPNILNPIHLTPEEIAEVYTASLPGALADNKTNSPYFAELGKLLPQGHDVWQPFTSGLLGRCRSSGSPSWAYHDYLMSHVNLSPFQRFKMDIMWSTNKIRFHKNYGDLNATSNVTFKRAFGYLHEEAEICQTWNGQILSLLNLCRTSHDNFDKAMRISHPGTIWPDGKLKLFKKGYINRCPGEKERECIHHMFPLDQNQREQLTQLYYETWPHMKVKIA